MYPGATPDHVEVTNGGSEANCIALMAPRRARRRSRDDDAELHAGRRPRARARRDRRSLAARRRRDARLAGAPISTRSAALVGTRTKADPHLQPEQSHRRPPDGGRARRDLPHRRRARRLGALRRDLPRRRARRRRDADGVGTLRARDRHERTVEGVRPARACASAGLPGRRRSSRRCGASTTTRRSRPAPSTIGWRASRSRPRGGATPRADARHPARELSDPARLARRRAPLLSHIAPRGRRHRLRPLSPRDQLDARSSSGCETSTSVLVVPGDHFEMDGYLRIGFGSDPAHLSSSLERIGALLDTIPAGAAADAR